MKKLALFLSFVLCLGLFVPCAVSAEGELAKTIKVLDPGFEKVSDGWSLSGRAEITDKYAHSGKYSLALPNTDDGDDADAAQTITGLVKGATYEIVVKIFFRRFLVQSPLPGVPVAQPR